MIPIVCLHGNVSARMSYTTSFEGGAAVLVGYMSNYRRLLPGLHCMYYWLAITRCICDSIELKDF